MSNEKYYATEKFEEITRQESSYNLVVLLKEAESGSSEVEAYFKFDKKTDEKNKGPLAANERIVFEFAEILEIPVTTVKFLTYDEMKGHISYAVPGDYEVWDQLEIKFADRFGADIRNRVRECFVDIEPFFAMLVFDTWILNNDRHSKNFMGTLLPGYDKLSLYLIDHGHSLIGPKSKWDGIKANEDTWLDVKLFIREPNVAKLVTDFSQLNPYITKIEGILDETIDEIVDNIPREYINEEEGNYIKYMLKKRRERLREMFRNWCEEEGKIKKAI